LEVETERIDEALKVLNKRKKRRVNVEGISEKKGQRQNKKMAAEMGKD